LPRIIFELYHSQDVEKKEDLNLVGTQVFQGKAEASILLDAREKNEETPMKV
jgi:hypothetical protein